MALDRFHVVVEAASDATQDDTCFFGLYDGHLGDQVSSFLDDNMHSAVFRWAPLGALQQGHLLGEEVLEWWRDVNTANAV